MVTCVRPSPAATYPHHGRSKNPFRIIGLYSTLSHGQAARSFYANPAERVVTFAKPSAEKAAVETRPACNCSLQRAPLESGGEKSIGTVQVTPKAHASASLKRYALLGKNRLARQGLEVGTRSSEVVRNRLVLRFQDAAGRIHQSAAGLHESRSGTQDGALFL